MKRKERIRRLFVCAKLGMELTGYEVGEIVGSWVTVYPELASLEREGVITSRWEDEPLPGQKFRRRFYRLAKLA